LSGGFAVLSPDRSWAGRDHRKDVQQRPTGIEDNKLYYDFIGLVTFN
jgi:hypothetical protein